MTLLILTPTLGINPLLRETVASVAAAGTKVRHVVIVPGNAAAAARELAPGAQIVAEVAGGERCGLYAALNAGVRAASEADMAWDALTWINDDDRLCAPGFGQLLRKFESHAGTAIAYGKVAMIDRCGARLGGLPVARRGVDLAPLLARGIMPLAQPGTVIARTVWEKLGGLDASYRLAGDLDFFARALGAGVRFDFVDAEVAEFRLSAGQLSKQTEAAEREKTRALAALAGVAPAAGAHWRFRWQNLGLYAERVRRHGFVSMQELTTRTQ